MEARCTTLADLEKEAARFAGTLTPREGAATLVTLSGDLGAGKTTFTKAAAAALGVTEHVTSPTFVLEKVYALPEGGAFARLVHIDAYRLEGGEALAPLGFDEIVLDPKTLILLEWPEQVADGLPEPAARVTLTAHDDESRTISYA